MSFHSGIAVLEWLKWYRAFSLIDQVTSRPQTPDFAKSIDVSIMLSTGSGIIPIQGVWLSRIDVCQLAFRGLDLCWHSPGPG